jgi:hypothetical protein
MLLPRVHEHLLLLPAYQGAAQRTAVYRKRVVPRSPHRHISVGTVSAPGMGSAGCRTFVELKLSGALDARHHQGDFPTLLLSSPLYGNNPQLWVAVPAVWHGYAVMPPA